MKNSNHELVGQLELASPTGRGWAAVALRRGRRAPTQSQILHPRTYHARLVSQMQSSGQMRSPGSDAPRLCASPETSAMASSGHTATACLLCLSLGTSEQGMQEWKRRCIYGVNTPFCQSHQLSLVGLERPQSPLQGQGTHTIKFVSAWHDALAWGCNSIIWLTQERAIGVISLPNKVEKNAENSILKIEGRKSVYLFSGSSLWSLTKRMVVKLPGLCPWSLEYPFWQGHPSFSVWLAPACSSQLICRKCVCVLSRTVALACFVSLIGRLA